MQRRNFVKTTLLGSLAVGLSGFGPTDKTHVLTLSFDDGFKKSFYRIADIYENFGLKACLNVIATGHLTGVQLPNAIFKSDRGNFTDWNLLQKRGHEIMPHSWNHANLTQMPPDQAMEDIDKCLDYFKEHLEGFNASRSVYNFAFNASTAELEQYALTKVRAVRTQGDKALNPFPDSPKPVRLGCWSFGPDNADNWVEHQINEFINSSGGWLILNLHGLDDEGWGPVSSVYLTGLLKRIIKIDFLELLPAGVVLSRSRA